MIDTIASSTYTMDCEICDSGTAVSRCLQCDQQMCAECKGMHLKFKATRDHSFADFDEDKQQKIHQVIPTSISSINIR